MASGGQQAVGADGIPGNKDTILMQIHLQNREKKIYSMQTLL